MSIVQKVKNEISRLNQKFIEESDDGYDFWENHIKFVVDEGKKLAGEYGADLEIVELGALLHDIALVAKVGTKVDHNENGAKLAERMLIEFNYPEYKTRKVVGCVLHHRSSKNAQTIEELCVADADIIAHFLNHDMIFNVSKKRGYTRAKTIEWMMKDYNDLSSKTRERYNTSLKKIIDEFVEKVNNADDSFFEEE